jgi:hypothetical protein
MLQRFVKDGAPGHEPQRPTAPPHHQQPVAWSHPDCWRHLKLTIFADVTSGQAALLQRPRTLGK